MRKAVTIAVALLGLAAAVGITVAANSLTRQPVGLSNEPLTAGEQLAVPTSSTPRAPERRPAPKPSTTSTSPRPTVTDDRSLGVDGRTDPGSGDDSSGRDSSDRGSSAPDDSGGDDSGSDDSGSDDSGHGGGDD
jgi:hypothetical protein